MLSISLYPSASTRLPLRVYHLNVSSYSLGTSFSMRLIVSGAPLVATMHRPFGRLDTVLMRLSADENWNRRRTRICVRCGAAGSTGETLSPFASCQFSASSVVRSMGSPTIVPSSRRTSACAAARARVVSRPVALTSTSLIGSEGLCAGKRSPLAKEVWTHSTPATPSTTRFSAVMVPVLSKQQTSTRPAKGMRKGSVQKIASRTLSLHSVGSGQT